ncbi:MFS transporter [Streptomyces roseoverticillatus]|uniref:MFS transporter n=1 Tax=Streptomyces roseoverticillatus TaxID=66429 RepID=UPI001F1C9237|nr:MFS transporter [Streptomyces roseoverticillatus]
MGADPHHRRPGQCAAVPPPRGGLLLHAAFFGGISLFGSMMLLPLYFQQVRGEDALGAALLLIPQGVGALLARSLAGKYTDRIGSRGVAVAAFTFVAAATVPFAFVTADTYVIPAEDFAASYDRLLAPLTAVLSCRPSRCRASRTRAGRRRG